MEWACRWLWPVVVYLLTCSHTHETLSGRIYGRKARLLNLNIIGWLLWECRWHRAPRIPRSFLSRATRTNPRASRLSADEKITRRDKDLCLLSKRTREQTVSRKRDSALEGEKFFYFSLSLSLSSSSTRCLQLIIPLVPRLPLENARCLPAREAYVNSRTIIALYLGRCK